MRTQIAEPFAATAAGAIAQEVLRACVHCGLCNAACPTFRLTGDELDGPRGRIYLVKGALEGQPAGRLSQVHLDRCLSCRACETACPSGVQYHRLADVGRQYLAARVRRPWRERAHRALLRTVFGSPFLARAAFGVGRAARPLLPPRLAARIPRRAPRLVRPATTPGRRMEVLSGCVQAAAAPHFNAAAARVFARLGIALVETPGVACCGALFAHLDAPERARSLARRNIDRWLGAIDAGSQALVVASSGCAAFIHDYADLLADDPRWRDKAQRLSIWMKDPVQVIEENEPTPARRPAGPAIAVHEPCTLRHGLKLAGRIGAVLERLGYLSTPVADADLCCGSAGAYSLTQPALAGPLGAAKIAALTAGAPQAIVTANIGCWLQLSERSPVPVRHWLEAIDEVTGAQEDMTGL